MEYTENLLRLSQKNSKNSETIKIYQIYQKFIRKSGKFKIDFKCWSVLVSILKKTKETHL